MTSLVAAVIIASFQAAQPPGGEPPRHPEALNLMNWKAATYVLNSDGSVIAERISRGDAKLLSMKSNGFAEKFGSASAHGLAAGDYPPIEMCIGGEWTSSLIGAHYAGPETNFLFDASVVLAEVAVTATVSEVIAGFSSEWPHNLVALTDVAPLHDASPIPDYVMIPVGRVVTHDRVFCAGDPTQSVSYRVSPGMRVVVVGSWHQGVVPVVTPGEGNTGLIGVFDTDGTIDWLSEVRGGGPTDLAGLQRRVDDMAVGGLLDLRAEVSRQARYSRDRNRIGEMFLDQYMDGCRIIGLENFGPDQRVVRVCAPGSPSEAALKLDKPAAQPCARAEMREDVPGGAWETVTDCRLYTLTGRRLSR